MVGGGFRLPPPPETRKAQIRPRNEFSRSFGKHKRLHEKEVTPPDYWRVQNLASSKGNGGVQITRGTRTPQNPKFYISHILRRKFLAFWGQVCLKCPNCILGHLAGYFWSAALCTPHSDGPPSAASCCSTGLLSRTFFVNLLSRKSSFVGCRLWAASCCPEVFTFLIHQNGPLFCCSC